MAAWSRSRRERRQAEADTLIAQVGQGRTISTVEQQQAAARDRESLPVWSPQFSTNLIANMSSLFSRDSVPEDILEPAGPVVTPTIRSSLNGRTIRWEEAQVEPAVTLQNQSSYRTVYTIPDTPTEETN